MPPQVVWKPEIEPILCSGGGEIVLRKFALEYADILVAGGHAGPDDSEGEEEGDGDDEDEGAAEGEEMEEGFEAGSASTGCSVWCAQGWV
jgi:hypothetical protein